MTTSESVHAASETMTNGRKSIGLRWKNRSNPISMGRKAPAPSRSKASPQDKCTGEKVPASMTQEPKAALVVACFAGAPVPIGRWRTPRPGAFARDYYDKLLKYY